MERNNTLKVAGCHDEGEWIYSSPFVYLNKNTMKKYSLKENDYIKLYCWSKCIIGKVIINTTGKLEDCNIRLSSVQRRNLRVTIGSNVKFKQIYEISICKEVTLFFPLHNKANIEDIIELIKFLKTPICKGNIVYIKTNKGYLKYKVSNVKSRTYGFINSTTRVKICIKKAKVAEPPVNLIEKVSQVKFIAENQLSGKLAKILERLIIPVALMLMQFAVIQFYKSK
jgi:hypothetical protein